MPIPGTKTPDAKGKAGDRVRLLTLSSLDQRTKAAKRAREFQSELEAELGPVELIPGSERQLIRRAAVLGAMAEDLEARILAGEKVDRMEYLAVANAQHRALESLGVISSGGEA